MKKALMVTEYYPPAPGPATARIGSFLRYLPQLGWMPIIVTPAHARPVGLGPSRPSPDVPACAKTGLKLADFSHVRVIRTQSFLPAPVVAAIDRLFLTSAGLPTALRPPTSDGGTVDWFCAALRAIFAAAREERPDVIYSTAPPVTGHFAAALAARCLQIPLVLDFRDLWRDNPGYTASPPVAALHRLCEGWLLRTASRVIVNTAGAHRLLRQRYSYVPRLDRKMWVIPNGFCEEDFRLQTSPRGAPPFRLCFAGKLYGDFGRNLWDAELIDRRGLAGWRPPRKSSLMPPTLSCLNPVEVLDALRGLLDAGTLARGELCLEFIGNHGSGNAALARALGLDDVVRFRGTVDAEKALAAVRSADALLLLSSGAGHVVPAKTYEYLAAGKPLMVVAPPGDLENLLRASGVTWFGAQPGDRHSVSSALAELVQFLRSGAPSSAARPEYLARFERRRQAARLATVLDAAAGPQIADCGLRIADLGDRSNIDIDEDMPTADPDADRNPQSAIRNPEAGGVP